MSSTGRVIEAVQNPSIAATSLSNVPDGVELVPVELMAADKALSRGLLYRPRGARPKVGVHLMHPRTDQTTNYNILPLVEAGYVVLGRNGRWANNDSSTTHEHLLLDMAAGIRLLQQIGCEQVVLLGNSGGSSLAAFYQAQACARPGERLTHTAAGDPFDLNAFDLPAADGIVVIGGHIGQGGVMGKLIDPSVVDEEDPLATDPTLDMYDPENGFRQPPESSRYSAEFRATFEAAQAARIRRIDAKAFSILERQREARAVLEELGDRASLAQFRAAKLERHMIIYRTTAYPAFCDTSIEPDGRLVDSYFTPTPQIENYGPNGFARYITPRAWLSTWSPNHTPAHTIPNLARQDRPLLVVHYSGDCGTRLSEAQAMFDVSPSAVKHHEVIHGIDHYGMRIGEYGVRGERVWDGTKRVVEWMQGHFPV